MKPRSLGLKIGSHPSFAIASSAPNDFQTDPLASLRVYIGPHPTFHSHNASSGEDKGQQFSMSTAGKKTAEQRGSLRRSGD